jgi:hypothetical protein
MAAKVRHPAVLDARGGQTPLQRFAVEVWKPPRRREGADVDQQPDLMRPQQFDVLFDGAGRMSNRVNRRQMIDHQDRKTRRNSKCKIQNAKEPEDVRFAFCILNFAFACFVPS